MPDETREERLAAALSVILDMVDYTTGACAPTEMVAAVLPREVIAIARKALQPGEPHA